jgi:hypothetical protein
MVTKIPNGHKNTEWSQKYRMVTKITNGHKNTKWSQNITNGRKICQNAKIRKNFLLPQS